MLTYKRFMVVESLAVPFAQLDSAVFQTLSWVSKRGENSVACILM